MAPDDVAPDEMAPDDMASDGTVGRGEEQGDGLLAPGIAAAGAETGMVTAELAVALPALVLVALVALSGLQVTMTQLRCRDAAAIAARLTARGESAAAVTAAMSSADPAGGRFVVRRDGQLVQVQVSAAVPLLGVGRLLPPFVVSATAAAVDDVAAVP